MSLYIIYSICYLYVGFILIWFTNLSTDLPPISSLRSAEPFDQLSAAACVTETLICVILFRFLAEWYKLGK
jgi:hypothetical protein